MADSNLTIAPRAIRLSVAPMLDKTDTHCRYFHRLLAPDARLYSEMITTGALLHGHRDDLLSFNSDEHPLALQLGGSDPDALARCCEVAANRGFDEVNLNVGCPSDRVQNGRFGACLMAEPALVANCARAMQRACGLPVSVKTRIGIDDMDSYDLLCRFVETVAAAGCRIFIIHARKAWLSGLSPHENRTVPPLRYDTVYRLKQDYPSLTIVINGGIRTVAEALEHVEHCDGVMIGREAYDNPYLLTSLQEALFGEPALPPSRVEIIEQMSDYLARQIAAGIPAKRISRHMLGLFHGQPGARAWRRWLSEHAWQRDVDSALLFTASRAMSVSEIGAAVI
ncbi:MAG: tRNA dihydrouridine(20/20a) synthase DusA [Gammaproteobacteria bacterium]|nr:tRNA dihydrouridine(20/20a) synthase DusA [Gammaproteobacteria bacterium]